METARRPRGAPCLDQNRSIPQQRPVGFEGECHQHDYGYFASAACGSIEVFAAQRLFYDVPVSATTVICTVVSIGLFGYGVAGFFRPVGVFSVEAVYWSTLPMVKTIQGLHWEDVKSSKPIRWFWWSFAGMSLWQVFPSYIFPWLNSISIPCIASMGAVGEKAATLTNLFGGSINNEGLGMFSISRLAICQLFLVKTRHN